MVKQLFNIETGEDSSGLQQVLSVAIGERHCGFAITDKSGDKLYKLVYYSIEDAGEASLARVFHEHPEVNDTFYKVLISYDHPQSTLVPQSQYKPDDAGLLLKTLYGVNGVSTVITEPVTEWQVYNVYAVPRELHDWIARKFSAGKYWHQYTLNIKHLTSAGADGQLLVDFRKDDFTVLAAVGNKLLFSQTFIYATPDDVLFYLLKVCQQFNLSQREVILQVSGLVDKQSALYKELYQYFIHILFREAGWNTPGDYPAHFFTSLNDLAKCAS